MTTVPVVATASVKAAKVVAAAAGVAAAAVTDADAAAVVVLCVSPAVREWLSSEARQLFGK